MKAEGVFLDGLELRNAENDSKLNQAQAILTEIPFMRDYLTARDRCRYLMAALEEREEGGSEEYQISNPKRLCQDGVRSQGCKDEHKGRLRISLSYIILFMFHSFHPFVVRGGRKS